jgi:hypothetical protein
MLIFFINLIIRISAFPDCDDSVVIIYVTMMPPIERHRFFGLPLPEVEEAEAVILAEKEIRSGRAK